MADSVQSKDLTKQRRDLETRLAAAGIDASKPDFLRRAYDQLVESRTRLAVLKELADYGRLQETPATGGVAPPDRTQSPQIGTTIGDGPGLGLGGEALDEGQKLKDEFLDRMWSHFEQGGLKISPGQAGGRNEPGDGASGGGVVPQDAGDDSSKDIADEALADAQRSRENAMKDAEAQLEEVQALQSLGIAAAATDETTKTMAMARYWEIRVKQHIDRVKQAEDGAKKALDRLRQPTPDAADAGGTLSVGGMAPKKPGKPGDPLPDNPNTEPSHVLKQRGQATDPNPAADYWGLGAPKAIRTTSDAVTDPPRAERKGLFGLFRSGS